MINLRLVNFEQLEEEKQKQVKELIDQRLQYFNELFKRYPTNVVFEFKFQRKPSGWKVDAMVQMQSATLYFEQSDKNIIKALSAIFSKMKNQVKKQKAIERKDYEYKRSKYRKKKLTQKMFIELIELHKHRDRQGFDQLMKDVYQDLHQDIKENYLAKGKTEKEAEILTAELMEKIKKEVFETFSAKEDEREEFLDSLSDISHYYQNQTN